MSFFLTTLFRIYSSCIFSIQAGQALPERFSTAEDIAGLASFLLSEDAAMITGVSNILSLLMYVSHLSGIRQDKVWVPIA